MRGPRGLPRGTPELVAIGWGEVAWDSGAPYLAAARGSVTVGPLGLSGAGPYLTTLRLDGAHEVSRLHVQVSPQASGDAYEVRASRSGSAVVVATADTATPFAFTVLEER